MPNVIGSKDPRAWKPEQYKSWLSVGEVAELCQRDATRIKQLEKEGRIPAPIRIRVGRLSMRLYSPEEAANIVTHFKNAKPGRPWPPNPDRKRRRRRKKGGKR